MTEITPPPPSPCEHARSFDSSLGAGGVSLGRLDPDAFFSLVAKDCLNDWVDPLLAFIFAFFPFSAGCHFVLFGGTRLSAPAGSFAAPDDDSPPRRITSQVSPF